MKKSIFWLLALLPFASLGQSTVKEFINKGVALHDEGKYTEAIENYKKALQLEKDNLEANYEIALSYTSMKDHKTAIEYADKLIDSKTDFVGKGYHLKGMNLDYMGKPKEAISAFKKGIKNAPDYTTLYYSLAITSYQQKDAETAEEALHNGILKNPLHVNSHRMLGIIKQNERPKSLLALYNFLLLEPTGKRANEIYNMVLAQHKIGVEVEDDSNIKIYVDLDNHDEFSAAEMMLSMMEASKSLDENKNKSDFELFSENTRSFFKILGELKANEKRKGFWWDYYVNFFYSIAQDDDLYNAYIHYISQDMNYTAVETWLQNNEDKVDRMLDWVEAYKIQD
jgi:Tfp pilus assembly protein PilF